VLIISALPETLSQERRALAAAVLGKPFRLNTLRRSHTGVHARPREQAVTRSGRLRFLDFVGINLILVHR
jgi:hypothetical protein